MNTYPTERRNRQICEMAENGATIYQIGKFFNLTPARIAQILNTNKVKTERAARYGKTQRVGTNIETKTRDAFTQAREKAGLKWGQAVEEALRLFIQKYGG